MMPLQFAGLSTMTRIAGQRLRFLIRSDQICQSLGISRLASIVKDEIAEMMFTFIIYNER